MSIERLRVWLLVSAGLLLVAIAGFLGYARLRAHRLLTDLPRKLGADLRQETNGFTYSQSVRGKTVFTVHAARAAQRTDGKVLLHDVGIVLYGRTDDRTDRIYGKEFEYDEAAGVIRAQGEVHLDLQAPSGGGPEHRGVPAAGGTDLHEPDSEVIRARTSGLIFLQKLGVASTEQEIEFELQGMRGRALGADYSSDTGMLTLERDVRLAGVQQGTAIDLAAARAILDRTSNRVSLDQARYRRGTGERASLLTSDHAVLCLPQAAKPDTPRCLEARGHVSLQEAGATVIADHAQVMLSPRNRPSAAEFDGDVAVERDSPGEQMRGRAHAGTVWFAAGDSGVERIRLTGSVALDETLGTAGGGARRGTRRLTADAVESRFSIEQGQSSPRLIQADGGARLLITDELAVGKRSVESDLRAEHLTAQLRGVGGAAELVAIKGDGGTSLDRKDAAGGEDRSTGDHLEMNFAPAPAAESKGKGSTGFAGSRVARAVQQGSVVVWRTPAPRAGSASEPPQHAVAQRAVYEAEGDRLLLSGDVKLSQGSSEVRADKVEMLQNGLGRAEGDVRLSYPSAAGADTVHVVASRMETDRDRDQAKFFGGANAPARLWQGSTQVQAPEIAFARKGETLRAGGGAVCTVLSGGVEVSPSAKNESPGRAITVVSDGLFYTEAERRAEFSGGVTVRGVDGTVRSSAATVFLLPAPGAPPKAPVAGGASIATAPAPGGRVERVVATGDVRLEQADRQARGEQLTYTARDGAFVLTGTEGAPPTVHDAVRGTVTGARIRFVSGDQSIAVTGAEREGVPGRRVRTETRIDR